MAKFEKGVRVRKISGSEWQGHIVGTYSTALTPEGYCVESEFHKNSVQLYPAKALELVPEAEPAPDLCDDEGCPHHGTPHVCIYRTASQPAPASQGVAGEVAAERQRQTSVEGWTPDHDDKHDQEELARAAHCYLIGRKTMGVWPWSPQWWKPTTRRRDLIKAAALIIAEIERLDRAAAHQPAAHQPAAHQPAANEGEK